MHVSSYEPMKRDIGAERKKTIDVPEIPPIHLLWVRTERTEPQLLVNPQLVRPLHAPVVLFEQKLVGTRILTIERQRLPAHNQAGHHLPSMSGFLFATAKQKTPHETDTR